MLSLPSLSELPALYPDGQMMALMTSEGELVHFISGAPPDELASTAVLVCHRLWTQARLGTELSYYLDILELYAFVRPARFCLPTAAGLARQLGLRQPHSAAQNLMTLGMSAQMLLDELSALPQSRRTALAGIAEMMRRGGWLWAGEVLQALGAPPSSDGPPDGRAAHIWAHLDETAEIPPRAMAGQSAVPAEAAQRRLQQMLGSAAEIRDSQSDYARQLCHIFASTENADAPHMILAEAGTGTGKTMGYLASASLWAEHNQAPVWISTYTRTLQHQIEAELSRLYPDADERHRRVVIRKGRENYLCLLNFEEALARMPGQPASAIALGLMARWAEHTSDGDLTGSQFPAWLVDLLGGRQTIGLADRRGECIHSGCTHYQKCFGEKSIRKSRRADIVIANHALVMVQAVMADPSEQHRPTRFIFDEGHHVFDAADNAFSAVLSALETQELRRWVRGAEEGRGGRARGLHKRLEEIIADDDEALAALDDVREAARILPSAGWQKRLTENSPLGLAETFFLDVRKSLYAKTDNPHSVYDVQADTYPAADNVLASGRAFADGLETLLSPLMTLAKQLEKKLDDNPEDLDSQTRIRLEGAARSLMRRASGPVSSWLLMLKDLSCEGRDGFVDWMQISRIDGNDRDVGLFRHWLDPSRPFSEYVLEPAHGIAITSATLTDGAGPAAEPPAGLSDPSPQNWLMAKQLTGAAHLSTPCLVSSHNSPFEYGRQSKLFIINDVARDRAEAVAGAMSGLIGASGGRALALFTSIQRLRSTWPYLSRKMADKNIPLYAQHQDRMNLQTLLQLFKEDETSVLMGTDAVRDGVDVPGPALQMMIYDRVPWPRPDKLFQARADHWGRTEWTDRITRMKLRQAFGRLIRRKDDKGVFVVLDSRMPTRLTDAFPADVEIVRTGLQDAISHISDFLSNTDDGEK